MNVQSQTNFLQELPRDLFYHMMPFVPKKQAAVLSSTSREMHHITTEELTRIAFADAARLSEEIEEIQKEQKSLPSKLRATEENVLKLKKIRALTEELIDNKKVLNQLNIPEPAFSKSIPECKLDLMRIAAEIRSLQKRIQDVGMMCLHKWIFEIRFPMV